MNSRHGKGVLVAIVSVLWLAGGSDLRATEERPASFDCTKDRTPLALIVCSDQKASVAERRTATAYLALYFSLDENRRAGFRDDHFHWVSSLTAQCTPSTAPIQMLGTPTGPSRECITRAYMLRAESYRRKLDGSALQETNLQPNELRRIQRRLIDLKFLSGNIDGVFGSETRLAIRSYQTSIGHSKANFLTADERNMLLAPASTATQTLTQTPVAAQTSISTQTPMRVPEPSPEVPSPQPSAGQGNQNATQTLTQTPVAAQTSISTQTPMRVPESSPEVPSPQPSTGQDNQNLESRLSNTDANMPASGQLVQPSLLEAVNPSGEPELTDEADVPDKKLADKPQPSYFTQAVLLLLVTVAACMGMFLLMGVLLLMTLHHGQTREVNEAAPAMPQPNDSSGARGSNQISTPNSQVVAPIPVPSVG